MEELIKILATLGIVVPEGTTFADLPKVLKQHKKVLKAHDELANAQSAGPETDEETPAPGDEETPKPGDEETPKPDDEGTPKPGDEETPKPGDEETPKPDGAKTPPASVVKKDGANNDDKPIKNKFVVER